MSTCVVPLSSIMKCQALDEGDACDEASAVADGASVTESSFLPQPRSRGSARRQPSEVVAEDAIREGGTAIILRQDT